MKFTDRMEAFERRARTRAAAEPGAEARKREERLARTAARAQRIEAQRERLTEEDRQLAYALRVPKDRPGRVKLAHELLAVGGRERKMAEIAAIMGLSDGAIWQYIHYPEVATSGSPSPGKVEELEVAAERQKRPYESVGAWVKRRRKIVNVSQAELARRLGVPVKQVAAWERGDERPGPTATVQIRRALDQG